MKSRHHFRLSLKALYHEISRMGTLVEEALRKALTALSTANKDLAETVIREDEIVDSLQMTIEDECARLIATEQPVAADLREILTAIKIVTHLERIGDHARHIARVASGDIDERVTNMMPKIREMTEIGISMVHDSIAAFVAQDAEMAKMIAKRDDMVDTLHKSLYQELVDAMEASREKLDPFVEMLFLNRFLERLADHVTGMCEWVIFATKGEHPDLNP